MSTVPGNGGQTAAGPNLVGRQLGRYEIVSWIASGGMANVFVARALGVAGFERLVALKLLHPHIAHEHEFVSMFLDEARLAARIRHPNVVATLDISSSEAEGFYLVMELVEGHHLGKLMSGAAKQGFRLPTSVVLRIVVDALQGLGAAHDLMDAAGQPLQLVHRDVSPHNVLVGQDGIARLTDFGVAKAEARLAATRDGQFKGKLGYMAPEQVASGRCDRRSDLVAMGVLLWEALVGRRLFRADDTVGQIRAVLQQPIPPLSSIRPELAPLDAVLQRALARDPEARFPDAASFIEAIEAVASRHGGLATPRQVGESVRRFGPEAPTAQVRAPGSGSFPRGLSQATSLPAHAVSGSFPAWVPGPPTGPHAASGPTVVYAPAPPQKRRGALIAGLAAAVVVLVAAVGFLAGRGEGGVPAPIASASAAPLDASLLTGDGDSVPRMLEGEAPESPNPDLALAPTVVLRLHVDATGRVEEAQIYRSRLELAAFEEAALEAARSFRFAPARKAGQAVPVWFNWPVTFGPAPKPTTLLRLKGSDTIGGALAPALAKAWRKRNPQVGVAVEALGSSTAFEGLFDGSAEIGASSRTISAQEIAEAQRLGLQLRELVIGYDGVAIVVHPDNPVRNLTASQLSRIFAGKLRNWREVGGADAPIELVGRPEGSGTHAFFREKVLRLGNPGGPESFAPGIVVLEHNDEIVARVASRPHAISYVGLGSLTGKVRVVPVAPAPGRMAVAPSAEAVADGSYPFYRPLLLYTTGSPSGELRRFLEFVLSADGRALVQANGFVPSDVPVEAALPPETAAAR